MGKAIAAKLRLDRPGLEVLEIGCGWGGMALTLAYCKRRTWGNLLSTTQVQNADSSTVRTESTRIFQYDSSFESIDVGSIIYQHVRSRT